MKRTLAVFATALTLGLGVLAATLVAPAQAGNVGLGDLSGLGYSLGVRIDASAALKTQRMRAAKAAELRRRALLRGRR